jgi:photosystem II stability/assembly factor-like uncharacterized protein
MSVSCLVRDPIHHEVVYAGADTQGIFKSVDRGATWTQISTTVRPASLGISANGATLLAATAIAIQRSTDGGATWTRVVFGGVFLGQMRFHPTDPSRALAVLPVLTSDFEDTGVLAAGLSTDGGVTWQQASGLDGDFTGLTLEYFHDDPSVVFAFSTAFPLNAGKLWRSDDGGRTFHQIGAPETGSDGMRVMALFVAPNESSVALTGGILLRRTMNGGSTFDVPQTYASVGTPHADVHGMAADPHYNGTTNRRVVLWGDGGIYRTDDLLAPAVRWDHLNAGLANTQTYTFDITSTGRLIEGLQDTGFAVMNLPSTDADHRADGDAVAVAIDPTDAAQYFVTNYPLVGQVIRIIADGTNYGFADTTDGQRPIAGTFVIDPNDSQRMFAGSAILVRLEGFLPSSAPHPQKATRIRSYPAGSSMSAIAVKPGDSNVVWTASTDDPSDFTQRRATIELTTNALADTPTWKNARQLPIAVGPVRRLVLDPDNPLVAYAVGLHALMITRDGGLTWTDVSASAPALLLSRSLFTFARHPKQPNTWYLGGTLGLYGTQDGGTTWEPAPGMLGHLNTRHLLFPAGSDTLWAATWGRGLWSLDLTPPSPPKRRAAGR